MSTLRQRRVKVKEINREKGKLETEIGGGTDDWPIR